MAFLGLVAVERGNAREAFLWMLAATIVDGSDGVLARVAEVRVHAAGIDGSKLDDLVDYLTFVFLPAYLVFHFRMVPDPLGLPAVAAMLLSSAYGFSAIDAKTADHFFTGFPSYWNVAAFYLYALHTPPLANVVVLLALAALVFVRVGYVYPTRTPIWRSVTIALSVLWGAAIGVSIWLLPEPPRPLVIGSLLFPVYYLVLSLTLQRARR